jgi:hypothetical protein
MAAFVLWAGTASGVSEQPGAAAKPSGTVEFRDVDLGTQITECPQAGTNTEPTPLDRRELDEVERLSDRGDDTRANTEYSCFPQNETTIVVNPTDSDNIIGAQNDYRMGGSFNGINASSDGGRHWYDLIGPFPSDRMGHPRLSGRPCAHVRPRGHRLLREHRLQPHRRHERHLGQPIDERRLHLEPGLRRNRRLEPAEPD